jgi:hypothetical protein
MRESPSQPTKIRTPAIRISIRHKITRYPQRELRAPLRLFGITEPGLATS